MVRNMIEWLRFWWNAAESDIPFDRWHHAFRHATCEDI